MDINLTGVIASNVTQNQSWFSGSIPLLLSALIGAIATGAVTLLRDYLNNKRSKTNLLLQAYSKLIGEKFALCQSYENILNMSVDFYYNIGLEKEAECRAKKANASEAQSLLDQAEKIEEANAPNRDRSDRELLQLTKDLQNLWENIGQINGLIEDKDKFQKLIKNIKESIQEIEKFQRRLIAETKDGLPNARVVNLSAKLSIKSAWSEEKKAEITAYTIDLESKIDDLLDFVIETQRK